MSFETKVEGKPDQITSLADWLTSSLEPAVSTSGDKFSSARTSLGSEWQGETADAVVAWLGDAVGASDSLSTRVTDIATALTTYVSILSSVKTEAECIRSDATAGGLTVNGTVVQEPKDSSDATKSALYSSLSGRMAAANSTLATGQQDLRASLAPSDVDRMKNGYQIFNVVSDFARSGAPSMWTMYTRGFLAAEGRRLLGMSDEMEKIIMSGLPYGVLNPVNARSANAALNRAMMLEIKGKNLLLQSKTYEAVRAGSKIARNIRVAGGVLAVVGTGVGYWADRQDGESWDQALVSNVAATAAGAAAGAAMGAAVGSIIPGPGTAVGAAVGFTAGVVTSIVTSEKTDAFVDSLYEDKKGVMHAIGAAEPTARTMRGAVGLAKEVGNVAQKAWDKLGW
jgi:hypothetical protein